MEREEFGALFICIALLLLSVFTLQEFSQQENTGERFGGLGIAVAQLFDSEATSNKGNLVVLDVISRTPAAIKGIQKGDMITHIDGESVKGKDFGYLVLEKLRGDVGAKVNITIKRFREKSPLQFTLFRTEMQYSPAR